VKEGEFKRPTVLLLAARAANLCSNPDCLAITSGPSSEDDSAINVGEAAHIYGGKAGSARYEAAMTDEERSDSTNGIWLCRVCHKKIDADQVAHPAELLFEWKRDHEARVSSRLGKSSDMRVKVQDRILASFPEADYLAQQTILNKPDHWEYKLTAQLLRHFLSPIEERLRHLDEGFYALPVRRLRNDECFPWVSETMENLSRQVSALRELVNVGLKRAWGEPGVPGSDREIYAVCLLVRDGCERCFRVEESVRFIETSEEFSSVVRLMTGLLSPQLEKMFSISPWISSIFDQDRPQGAHQRELVFTLPDDWSEQIHAAMLSARKHL
jgi:hypothetical protein